MNEIANIDGNTIVWRLIKRDGLDLSYAVVLTKNIASEIFNELEETLEYFSGDLAKIKVYGKVYPLPRQQVAYGNPGITYKYSGCTVPARPWPAPVLTLKKLLLQIIGIDYDFVLVNRYRNGHDHMGEHRDNEPELDPAYSIASISLGQARTFTLKHKDARKSGKDKKPIPTVQVELEHGSILLMNPPTNAVWYHSLPKRVNAVGTRINLTFRKMRKR